MTPGRSWLALLAASKGCRTGGRSPAFGAGCSTEAAMVAQALADAAAGLGDDEFARLTQTPPNQLAQVRAANSGVASSPTLPAWQRYTGVVQTAADPASLDSPSRARFRRHVAWVSALAGLVPADELLPEYRLPMAANLAPIGPLASFWRQPIRDALAAMLAPGARLWLLTGGEYERAVEVPAGIRGVEVTFIEDRGGRPVSPPSAAVKQARGRIARHLAESPGAGRRPDGLAWEGFTFVAGLRQFQLVDADAASQRWHATPA